MAPPFSTPRFRESEEKTYLNAFIESIPDMVWAKDASGAFLTCNHVVEQFYGVPRARIIGKTDYDFADVLLADHFRKKDQAAMNATVPQVNQEWLTFANDSRPRLFETKKTPIRDAQGQVLGILGVARDITEHYEAKQRQESLNRALKLIVECNHAMMHAADENSLLSEICRLTVDVGGYLMAWVGFAEADEEKSVRPAAWSERGRAFLDEIQVSWADSEFGRGPVGKAIRSAETIVNQNSSTNSDIRPWQAITEQFGFRSSIALPLIQGGKAFGILVIYSAVPEAFGQEECQLLKEMTADLAFGIKTLRTRTAHEAAERKLEFLAHHDTLTGIPNRASLRGHFDRATARANSSSTSAVMLLLDIDNFRAVNDSFGHDHGDKVLVEVARRLQRRVRNAGVVCRHGGDEFAILLSPVCDFAAVEKFLRQLLSVFVEPIVVDGFSVTLTFSLGASFYPKDANTLEGAIASADTALQKAKETGKNNFCLFDKSMNSERQEQLVLLAELRNAVKNDELVLHYQPKIDLRTKAVVGVEALVRWWHPKKGLLGPGAFIPLAEKAGLIIQIGEWVLNRACEQMAAWQRAGLPLETISINVSGLQVRRGSLLPSVINALQRAGLPAHHIELELTESIFLHDLDKAINLFQEVRRLGVKLAIDDFGTGYSSLAYLQALRVDRLKIDQSFIRNIPANADAMAIVKTIIQLGRNLKLAITAEGVETEDQLQALTNFECDEVQGFLFSRPVGAVELAALCTRRPEEWARLL